MNLYSELIYSKKKKDNILKYNFKNTDVSVKVYSEEKVLSLEELQETMEKFKQKQTTSDKTGAVKIWPSETILTQHLILNSAHYINSTIIELGCGFSAMASIGLYNKLKTYKSQVGSLVIASDGDDSCMEKVKETAELNETKLELPCMFHPMNLTWDDNQSIKEVEEFLLKIEKEDISNSLFIKKRVAVGADILYNIGTHMKILRTLKKLDINRLVVVCGDRNGALNLFKELVEGLGYQISIKQMFEEYWQDQQNKFADKEKWNAKKVFLVETNLLMEGY